MNQLTMLVDILLEQGIALLTKSICKSLLQGVRRHDNREIAMKKAEPRISVLLPFAASFS